MNTIHTWIALAEVKDKNSVEEVLGDNVIGFVNILILAIDEAEARSLILKEVNELNLELLNLESLEVLSERLSKTDVDEEILSLANEISAENSFARLNISYL